jgi:type VI secretion system protein ImpC
MSNEISDLSFLPHKSGTLPFKLLVMAPLLGYKTLDSFSEPIVINKDNFDDVLHQYSPELEIDIDNPHLCQLMCIEQQTLVFNYVITHRNHFSPDAIIHKEPSLSAIANIIEQIQSKLQLDGMSFIGNDFNCGLIHIAALQQQKITRSELELLLCDFEGILSDILNEILHQPAWQQLESAWTGLDWLCQTAEKTSATIIECAAFNRDILWDDLSSSSDIADSQLYQMLFVNNIGQYGAVPYGALMIDDYFSGYGQDLSLLKQIVEVSSLAHIPIISGTSPKMFDVESYTDLQNASYISETHLSPKFIKWRNFINTEQASYLALTLPRLLFRTAYNKDNQALTWFDESIGDRHDSCLWGNASYGFVCNLIKSFEEHGFCTFISGNEGGVINTQAIANQPDSFPIEITFSEQKESELISLGFNPVCSRQYSHLLLFQSANSVRWGTLKLQHISQTVESIASAQMQYLLIAVRVIHCLKILFRESIGAATNSSELSIQLTRWLRQYVSDVESPSKQVRAQRPLRDGKVHIDEAHNTGWYEISIELVPHFKYLGESVSINASISIVEEVS